jgi:hypothetical protein
MDEATEAIIKSLRNVREAGKPASQQSQEYRNRNAQQVAQGAPGMELAVPTAQPPTKSKQDELEWDLLPERRFSALDENLELKDRFKLPGAESYIEKALAMQETDQARQQDQASRTAQQAFAQNLAAQGARGGLRGGGMAGTARANQRNLLEALQNVGAQGASQRQQIGLEGDKMGREIQRYNLEQELGQGQNLNTQEREDWKLLMADRAAKRSASATRQAANSGKK